MRGIIIEHQDVSPSKYIEVSVSLLLVVTTCVINRHHLTLYHLTLGRKWLEDGRERNKLSEKFLPLGASLPEHSDPGSYSSSVHPECSC